MRSPERPARSEATLREIVQHRRKEVTALQSEVGRLKAQVKELMQAQDSENAHRLVLAKKKEAGGLARQFEAALAENRRLKAQLPE
jgi:hypothetical protein